MFECSEESADTYAPSEAVTAIEAFMSHTWVAHCWQKYVCLAVHVKYWPAFLSAVVVLVVLGSVTGRRDPRRDLSDGSRCSVSFRNTFWGQVWIFPLLRGAYSLPG